MSEKPSSRPILVPVDFSPHSTAALLKAGEIAQCMQLPITVLHVVHDPADMPGYYTKIAKKKTLVRIEDLASEMFDKFMQESISRHPELKSLKKASTLLVLGLPVTRILQIAKKINASMIVMGSQGRTGLKHMMLGSKAEQIVRLSPVPVTIVKK